MKQINGSLAPEVEAATDYKKGQSKDLLGIGSCLALDGMTVTQQCVLPKAC